jgi:hypothetical protein
MLANNLLGLKPYKLAVSGKEAHDQHVFMPSTINIISSEKIHCTEGTEATEATVNSVP